MKIPARPLTIGAIPAIVWGAPSDKLYLFAHGKMSSKESAAPFAQIAAERGWQTLSFDLPDHGERAGSDERCDLFSGIRDLKAVGGYAFDRWKAFGLYGCSLGAFFSLHAYADRQFENCLFQSPIVDMEALIHQMFSWFGVTEKRLEREREIPTPIDTLSWDSYRYVHDHPILAWSSPTHILYAARDALQSRETIERFCQDHGCALTVSETSDHGFLTPEDQPIVDAWLRHCLEKT